MTRNSTTTHANRQTLLYLGMWASGALLGLLFPGTAQLFERLVWPALAAALYVTFLQVPFVAIGRGLRDARFLGAALVLNFVVVPLFVWGLTRFVPPDPGLLLGMFLVLLVPCTDWVVLFTERGGGATHATVAMLPLLLVAQLLLLPFYLWLFLGEGALLVVRSGPFLQAFGLVVAAPFVLAWATEAVLPANASRWWSDRIGSAAVPLLALVLVSVAASQVGAVRAHLGVVLPAIVVFVVYMALMPWLALLVARLFRLGTGHARSLVFTGGTRNSFVVLPLALALDQELYVLAGAVIAAEILVELVAMLAYVRWVPRRVVEVARRER